MSESYKGWTNYETWLVHSYLQGSMDSGHDICGHVKRLVAKTIEKSDRDHTDSKPWSKQEYRLFRLAYALKELTEDGAWDAANPGEPSLLARKLIDAAIRRANWEQITEYQISAYQVRCDERRQ